MKLNGLKINFLGDSITEGVGVSCSEHIYLNLLAAEYGFTARNYGVSGSRIANQLNPGNPNDRMERCFVTRIEDMDPDADVVVVFGGTNDFGHGDAPLGTPDDRSVNTYYGACHCLCRGLIEKYPNAEIVIMTSLHRTNEMNPRGDGWKAREYGILSTYVDILKEVASSYSLPILDLWNLSGIQPCVEAHRLTYMPDGLHPCDAGHRRIAGRLAAFLQAL